MSQLKRLPTKYVRDRAKSRYPKDDKCYVCGSTQKLDFHHYYTVSTLLNIWMRKNGKKAEDVLEWRDEFIERFSRELFEEGVTICHSLHLKLHDIYGKNPTLGTASKQRRWVEAQKEKHGAI